MKLRSSALLGFVCFGSILAMDFRLDCKDVAAAGLMDAIWYSASVSTAQDLIDQNNTDNQGQQGAPGAPGEGGVNCWDINGDGVNDAAEDVNGDGVWDAMDCQGASGEAGLTTQGAPGAPGADGADGASGSDGLNCWDLNGNGVFDVATEDVNGNGEPDIEDCRGADGQTLVNTVASGVIPGDEIPLIDPDFPNDPGADWIPPDDSVVGITRVYRPAPYTPGAPPIPGRYRVVLKLPDRDTDYVVEDLAMLVTVHAFFSGPHVPGQGGNPFPVMAFPEVVTIDNPAGTAELEVQTRLQPALAPLDVTFSLVVMTP